MSLILVVWDDDRAEGVLEKLGGYGIGEKLFAVPGAKLDDLRARLYKAGTHGNITLFHVTDISGYLITMTTPEGSELVKRTFPDAPTIDISGRP